MTTGRITIPSTTSRCQHTRDFGRCDKVRGHTGGCRYSFDTRGPARLSVPEYIEPIGFGYQCDACEQVISTTSGLESHLDLQHAADLYA